MQANRDEAGNVRHVHDHRRADRFGDGGDAREVDDARVGAGAHHDHLRRVLMREPLEFLVVNPLVVLADAVGDDRVELAGEVQRMAVREMTAMGEVHAEHGVAGIHDGEVHRHVGLCARVRLHVGVVGAEQRLGARNGQRLGDVHELAAAVVALAGVALGVLVGQHRARRLENRAAHEVLRRDQLEPFVLPLLLVANGLRNFRVGVGE